MPRRDAERGSGGTVGFESERGLDLGSSDDQKNGALPPAAPKWRPDAPDGGLGTAGHDAPKWEPPPVPGAGAYDAFEKSGIAATPVDGATSPDRPPALPSAGTLPPGFDPNLPGSLPPGFDPSLPKILPPPEPRRRRHTGAVVAAVLVAAVIFLLFTILTVALMRSAARVRTEARDQEARYRVAIALRNEESYYSRSKSFASASALRDYMASDRQNPLEYVDSTLPQGSAAVRISLTPAGGLCVVSRSASGTYWGAGEVVGEDGRRTIRYASSSTVDPLDPCTPEAINSGSPNPFPTQSPSVSSRPRR